MQSAARSKSPAGPKMDIELERGSASLRLSNSAAGLKAPRPGSALRKPGALAANGSLRVQALAAAATRGSFSGAAPAADGPPPAARATAGSFVGSATAAAALPGQAALDTVPEKHDPQHLPLPDVAGADASRRGSRDSLVTVYHGRQAGGNIAPSTPEHEPLAGQSPFVDVQKERTSVVAPFAPSSMKQRVPGQRAVDLTAASLLWLRQSVQLFNSMSHDTNQLLHANARLIARLTGAPAEAATPIPPLRLPETASAAGHPTSAAPPEQWPALAMPHPSAEPPPPPTAPAGSRGLSLAGRRESSSSGWLITAHHVPSAASAAPPSAPSTRHRAPGNVSPANSTGSAVAESAHDHQGPAPSVGLPPELLVAGEPGSSKAPQRSSKSSIVPMGAAAARTPGASRSGAEPSPRASGAGGAAPEPAVRSSRSAAALPSPSPHGASSRRTSANAAVVATATRTLSGSVAGSSGGAGPRSSASSRTPVKAGAGAAADDSSSAAAAPQAEEAASAAQPSPAKRTGRILAPLSAAGSPRQSLAGKAGSPGSLPAVGGRAKQLAQEELGESPTAAAAAATSFTHARPVGSSSPGVAAALMADPAHRPHALHGRLAPLAGKGGSPRAAQGSGSGGATRTPAELPPNA